ILGGLWPTEEGMKAAYAGGYRGDLYGEDIEARLAEYEAEARNAAAESAANTRKRIREERDQNGLPDDYIPPDYEREPGAAEIRRQQRQQRDSGGDSLLDKFINLFSSDDLSESIEEGSREMGQSFTDGAEGIRKASDDARGKMSDVGRNVEAGGDDIVRALGNAATAIDTAATKLTGAAGRLQRRQERANANPGKSMKPEDNAPAGAY
ncbi:hypothetical protein, partial [uncultured Martelella sp.]|uniref:hypothetical protein n=1 Tax=uncultured Martelella sp. TaxID=392331 RepID=UPI0029C759D8